MKTELLAPAKNKEIAFAAIDCGADAIYMGAYGYGARKNAANSLNEIKDVVNYAHKFWVKVFVTVNTILTDSELSDAVQLVKKLDKIGVDAILVQDMGLLNEIKKLNLSIPIHASTQCDNREPEKIKFLRDIGIKRVVLARELSLEQIKNIHTKYPDIELEAFIHGALCVSYSGQCYLSQHIGGRSANRGECAQPCRKKYTVLDENQNIIKKDFYALCLKDFNASEHIKEMIDCGVFSFKIEGRLKDKNYVKNIVSYYRTELDKYSEKISSGKSICPFTPDVEKTFNRGYTDYFLKGRKNCFNFVSPKSQGKYLGKVQESTQKSILIKTEQEINAQDGLCYQTENDLEGFLVNKAEKKDNVWIVYPNRSIKITKNTKIYRNLNVKFEKELTLPVKRQIGVSISINPNNIISAVDEDGVSVQIHINSKEIAKNPEQIKEVFKRQFLKTGNCDFYVHNIKIESNLPFISVSEINTLRRNIFEELIKKRLINYKRSEKSVIKFSEFYKKNIDYRGNVYNKSAEFFYNKCGTKVTEYCPEYKSPKHQIELMRTKHCIKYALNMCKLPKNLILQDDKGKQFHLKFDCKNCEMVVLSQ